MAEAFSKREQTSVLPDRVPKFTARETEIQNVITLLMNERKTVVSLHGGPGFGKTAIAIEVSYNLSEDHNTPVVFSQLTTATTVDEMIRRVCIDVGVNYGHDDPKPSLIHWLRSIEARVVFVMDDIDNLLEENNRPGLNDFIRLLGKIDNCQMITTSRLTYLIPGLSVGTVEIGEMDDPSCMELLREQCSKQDDEFLRKLAKLCGNIPLAMCIAASQVDEFDDSDEFCHYLEEQPLKILERPKSHVYVYRAINMSYERLHEEQKETIVRLSVFEGSFSEGAASFVAEKEKLDAKRMLKNLVCRSLIKQQTKNRYSIHLLIKHFLRDQLNGENEIAERIREQEMRAKLLMGKYYLKLGHDLTIKSYSKDGYKVNRDALKQEAHNIQNVLEICSLQSDPRTTSDISDYLAHSKIYTTSARFFSLFVRTIIPGSIVDEFLQRCAQLAEERKQHAIKINFDCLLAEQQRHKTIGKPDKCFSSKIEKIAKEFEEHYHDLQQDKSLCAHYHYQYGRYLLRKAESHLYQERLEIQIQAREELEKSLELRKTLPNKSMGRADEVFSLLHLGSIWQNISCSSEKLRQRRRDCENAAEKAQDYYKEAIQLSQDVLGEHELTSACYKNFGDLFLANQPELAEENYNFAKKMRQNLGLHASERHAYLLKNLGMCLTNSGRSKEAIEILESARDLAEKLSESEGPNVCKAKIYTNLAIVHNSGQRCSADAVEYAKKAMEFKEIKNVIKEYEYNELQEIFSSHAENY